MRDIVGEKTALDNTRFIINSIDKDQLSVKAYKKVVHLIFENQLKKFTNYGRLERRRLVRDIFNKAVSSEQKTNKKPFPAPTHFEKKVKQQRRMQKHSKNTAGQGSQ